MPEHSESLLRLVSSAELSAIAFLELSAARVEGDDRHETTVNPRFQLGIDTDADTRRFRVRLTVEVETPAGTVTATAAAAYEAPSAEPDELAPSVIVEYANEVAVMTLLPYLRHAVADMAVRVFDATVLMPTIPRGALHFQVPEGTQ